MHLLPRLDRIRRSLRQLLGLRTLRAHVVLLVMACIVPMVAFSAFAVLRYANAQREAGSQQIMNTARALSAAMDVELKTAEAALAALATSPALHDGDLVRFYEQCRTVGLARGAWTVLADPDGREIFHTQRALGEPGRMLSTSPLVTKAATTRAVQISDLYHGAKTTRMQISVILPVVEQDQVRHVLLMTINSEALSRALVEQHLPESWLVAAVDREHRIIARSHDIERFAGQAAAASLIEQMSTAREGTFTGTTLEGIQVSTAFTKSAYTGWTLAVGVPVAETAAPLESSLREIGLAAAVMLLLGTLLAAAVGGRMAELLRRLSSAALALGHGASVPPARQNIAEVDAVLGELDTAGALLRERSSQRDVAEQALRKSEQRFRDIAETAADWIWESDRAHRFTYFSGSETVSDGGDPAQVIGTTRWQYAGVDVERDEHWRQHKADLDAARPFRAFRYSLLGDGGRRIHCLVSGKPVFDESGEFVGYRGTATTETEVVEARQRAEQAEALLQDAVDSMSEGFLIYDKDDRLVMLNERYRSFFPPPQPDLVPGRTFEELLGEGIAQGRYAHAAGREQEFVAERLRCRREGSGGIEQQLADGRWLLVTDRRMRSGGIAGLRIDITALKQTQAALRESEARLDRAQRIAHIGSWELDIATGEFAWSKEIYRIRSLSPEDYRPTATGVDEFRHPEAAEWTRICKSASSIPSSRPRLSVKGRGLAFLWCMAS
jgi:PAS domain S-box-containing protein